MFTSEVAVLALEYLAVPLHLKAYGADQVGEQGTIFGVRVWRLQS